MRLKFQSLSQLDPQNMTKPIPHCSNSIKIVFWAWEGSNCTESKNFKNSNHQWCIGHLNPDAHIEILIFTIYHPLLTKLGIINWRTTHYSESFGFTDLIFSMQWSLMCFGKTLEFQQRSEASFSFPA